jgi:CubicO group peptidase (beta-lactamase class C family)
LLSFSPGTRWSYSSGLDVAGRVIEVSSGESLDRFLDEQIFRPLGMRDTGFRVRLTGVSAFATVYTPGPDGTSGARQRRTDGYVPAGGASGEVAGCSRRPTITSASRRCLSGGTRGDLPAA